MRVLLVEDEKILARTIAKKFKNAHVDVTVVYDGQDGLDEILYNQYDIVVLDIMLPNINGLDIITEVRTKNKDIPIILTSAKGETKDKIRGLEVGADDYLAKPYDFDELLMRIQTCLRRINLNPHLTNCHTFANLNLERNSLSISTSKNTLTLTLKEFNLLEYLIDSSPNTISKDQIIDKIWGYDNDVMHNQIEVYISYLRKKLKLLEANINIKTIRGVGYRIEQND